jgi:hypothetical protein
MIRKFEFFRLRIQWYSKPVAFLLNIREIDKREIRGWEVQDLREEVMEVE